MKKYLDLELCNLSGITIDEYTRLFDKLITEDIIKQAIDDDENTHAFIHEYIMSYHNEN